jgi:hypothetical protein
MGGPQPSNFLNLDRIIEFYDEQNGSKARENEANASKKINDINDSNIKKYVTELSQEKKTVNFYVKNKSNKLKFGKRIYEFYNAPVTKFWQNTIIYVAFLVCFAYIVLVKTPPRPSPPEIFVLIYIFAYGIDKIREVYLKQTILMILLSLFR